MITLGGAHHKFKAGLRLSYWEAILAHCYICVGKRENADGCKGAACPLYQFQPYRAGQAKDKENSNG